MKIRKLAGLAVMLVWMGEFALNAGTYKPITIDGAFDDWAGVPLAYSQPQDSTTTLAFQNIYVCNDSNFLYLRFTVYPPAANPFTAQQNIYLHCDDDVAGFHPASYDSFGSELLIQGGAGYQEKNGGFNEGAIVGLNWAAAPATGTNFEMRVSRRATYPDGKPVFVSNTIAIALEAENASFTSVEYAPTNGTGGLVYTFANRPPAASAPPASH